MSDFTLPPIPKLDRKLYRPPSPPNPNKEDILQYSKPSTRNASEIKKTLPLKKPQSLGPIQKQKRSLLFFPHINVTRLVPKPHIPSPAEIAKAQKRVDSFQQQKQITQKSPQKKSGIVK
jgi:hypothetical protein